VLPVSIRPATASDYDAISGVVAAYPPDHLYDYEFRTADEFRELDETFRVVGQPLTRYVAADNATGHVVGFAQHFEIAWSAPVGRHWLALRVHPAARRQGVGAQLYARAAEDLARLGARAVVVEMHESMGAQIEALRRHGFRELLRSWPFTLDPRGCDLAQFAHLAARAAPLQVTTLPEEQAHDPDWLPRLYDLYLAVSGDVPIPGHPLARPPLDWFTRQLIELPVSLPEACFLVRDGDRYAGLSYLHRDAETPGLLQQKITAIRPEYRGRGLAGALKVATIAFALRHGYTGIQTVVESNNPAMLAINARFGFAGGPGLILFERPLVNS
jgi:mycothiol synthase